MKPKNFPARKLKRQIGARLRAEGNTLAHEDERKQLEAARQVKSKKPRGSHVLTAWRRLRRGS